MLELSTRHFDPDQPYWSDYLTFLQALSGSGFPGCAQLNGLLPADLCSEGGAPIRFVASDELADEAYERRIYTSGQVSTRLNNWHDLFNAMVWMRFPRIKIAMNSLHFHAWSESGDGTRGKLRDALTLFDECGVIVFSNNMDILEALAQRHWNEAFLQEDFASAVGLSICGHAMLEKYLTPYKSMTAKALLLHVDLDFMTLPRDEQLSRIDKKIAAGMLEGKLLKKPACLAPLPLAGVPGWWPNEEQQDDSFYRDLQVFRSPPDGLKPAEIQTLQ